MWQQKRSKAKDEEALPSSWRSHSITMVVKKQSNIVTMMIAIHAILV
jgi:hypothetical protein